MPAATRAWESALAGRRLGGHVPRDGVFVRPQVSAGRRCRIIVGRHAAEFVKRSSLAKICGGLPAERLLVATSRGGAQRLGLWHDRYASCPGGNLQLCGGASGSVGL